MRFSEKCLEKKLFTCKNPISE